MIAADLLTHLSDEDLVRRIRNGEPALFELLVRRHNQRLYRTARSILKSGQAAEDAVQEAHITAFTKLESFEFRSRYATWLTRIAVREALTVRRRHKETAMAGNLLEETMSDPAHSPERRASSLELGRIIEDALDEVPEDFRVVFMLREVEGMSTAEAAEVLGLVEATVKTRLHRAKQHLQGLLERRVDHALEGVHAFAGQRCDRITHNVMARIRGEAP